jgi:putative ABC transport system substrate-binding protein
LGLQCDAAISTSRIPIVFISVGDPIGIGIVESLSHPGGNATGFTDVLADLSSKLVEFARELVAQAAPVGYLWHDKWLDGKNRLVATEQAAQAAGVALRPGAISEIVELDGIVSDMRSNGTTIIIVQPSPFTTGTEIGSSSFLPIKA